MSILGNYIDMNRKYDPLNECMYCASTDALSKEHIIPYGLKGPAAVPNSSCANCRNITSRFEMEVLRGPLYGLRAYLKLSSRRRKNMPTHLPFTIIRDGTEQEVSIPILEHPLIISFPVFAVPSQLTGKHVEGITVQRNLPVYNFGKPIDEVLKDYGAESYRFNEKSRPVELARLLAKIAWGFAIVNGQRNRLSSEVRDAMLYKPNEIGRWVGTYTDPLEMLESNLFHEVRIREDHQKGYLIGDVKLFANVQTPRYGVLLGKLD